MTVIIPKKAYLTIVGAATRFANQRIPREEWLEVSGVFIGKNKNNDVILSEAYPIMHQEFSREQIIDQYEWSHEDMALAAEIEMEAYDRGEFICGWWHSHPGYKIMMSSYDIRTTLSYQQNNPLAVALVFNPQRLIKQTELPVKKGDPVIKLENDPGFKIFRLDEVNKGISSGYHDIDYKIEGFDSMEHLVKYAQKLVIEIAKFFPKQNLFEKYEKFIEEQYTKLESLLIGTEEYLKTLARQGELNRITEVLENQKREINKFVGETFIKIENIKDFMNYLEYKERETVIPRVNEILSKWQEAMPKINERIVNIKEFLGNITKT